jgi:hypothetical protein
MLKDVDAKPKEPARRRAERNHDVEKRFKEEKTKPAPKESKNLEIAETINREKPDRRGSVIRAQTKFAKYIKELLDDHKQRNEQRNLIVYALSIRAQRYRLLKEKLRRLEAREAACVARQNQGGRRDLFG